MDPERYYQVIERQNAYHVIDGSGRSVIECSTEINAKHYAVLLSQAYYLGYKAGFSAGKSAIR